LDVVEPEAWAEQTRRMLTRDLIVRARHSPVGEGRALQFRALHLNLPLVARVADDLGLTAPEREAVEPAALDGLFQAVRRYDPWGDHDFATFATPFVRARMVEQLPISRRRTAYARRLPPRVPRQHPETRAERHLVRLLARRAAQTMAGYRT
jgi:DNA-directed RNA polymerase specialized sigma subunit